MHIRNNARAIILNEFEEVLLQRLVFENVVGEKVLWVTPGGGVKKGETTTRALEREIQEELDVIVTVDLAPVLKKDVTIHGKTGDFIRREFYYRLFLPRETKFSIKNMTSNEQDTFQSMRWWTKEELKDLDDVAPPELERYV